MVDDGPPEDQLLDRFIGPTSDGRRKAPTRPRELAGLTGIVGDQRSGGLRPEAKRARLTWDRLAQVCGQYLGKGQQVAIEGRLQTRQWDDDRGTTQCQGRPIYLGLDERCAHGSGDNCRRCSHSASD
ncbi:MAG: single-stranded DNA-binding protein [Candidatus Limnocylindrales bacterium]